MLILARSCSGSFICSLSGHNKSTTIITEKKGQDQGKCAFLCVLHHVHAACPFNPSILLSSATVVLHGKEDPLYSVFFFHLKGALIIIILLGNKVPSVQVGSDVYAFNIRSMTIEQYIQLHMFPWMLNLCVALVHQRNMFVL